VELRRVAFQIPVPVLRMDPRGPAFPKFLRDRTAGKRQPPLINEVARLIGTGHPDQDRSLVDNGAKATFALTLSVCRTSPRNDAGKNISGALKSRNQAGIPRLLPAKGAGTHHAKMLPSYHEGD